MGVRVHCCLCIPCRQSRLLRVRDLNDFLNAVGQLGMELTAGRHRMRDVTRLTMVPYFALFRLSRGLEAVGLGLSHLSWRLHLGSRERDLPKASTA